MDDLVLYVDDEPNNLATFQYVFDPEFSVHPARTGEEALAFLRDHDVAVLLTDQRMPEMTGVELCIHARAIRPDAFRVIVTAYADFQVAIDAINRGEANRFVLKPWRNEHLANLIRSGIERVRIERAIRAIEVDLAKRAVGSLAVSSMSDLVHEISLPLQTLEHHLKNATIAAEGRNVAATLQALRASTEAAALASTFLQRVSHHVREPTAICDAISVVAASVRIARAHTDRVAKLNLTLPTSEVLVAIEARSLSEITINLLINAAEALEEATTDNATIIVKLRSTDTDVLLTVADNGRGLEPEALARVFDPGFSTKSDDRGLGLAITRSIAHAANGDVQAKSEPGRGCAVEVRLPRAPPA